MPTTRPKHSSTLHGKHRVQQRYGGSKYVQEEIINRAKNYGVLIHQIPKSLPLYHFVEMKMYAMDRIVKLLDGYVFVFFKSGRLQTMYELPEEYKADWEQIKCKQDKNHEGYKRKKAHLANHRRKHP